MNFDWDDAKNDSNIDKHGVTFTMAARIWQNPGALLVEKDDRDYQEDRYIAQGLHPSGTLLVVVSTYRGDDIRIISARKAEPKERKRYYEKIYRSKR